MRDRRPQPDRPSRKKATELLSEKPEVLALELPFTITNLDIVRIVFNLAHLSSEVDREFSTSIGLLHNALQTAAELEASRPRDHTTQKIEAPANLAQMIEVGGITTNKLQTAAAAKRAWPSLPISDKLKSLAQKNLIQPDQTVAPHEYENAILSVTNAATLLQKPISLPSELLSTCVADCEKNIAALEPGGTNSTELIRRLYYLANLHLLARTLGAPLPKFPTTLRHTIESTRIAIADQPEGMGHAEHQLRAFKVRCHYAAWLINTPVRLEHGLFVVRQHEKNYPLPTRLSI